jgi:hypothetical protein
VPAGQATTYRTPSGALTSRATGSGVYPWVAVTENLDSRDADRARLLRALNNELEEPRGFASRALQPGSPNGNGGSSHQGDEWSASVHNPSIVENALRRELAALRSDLSAMADGLEAALGHEGDAVKDLRHGLVDVHRRQVLLEQRVEQLIESLQESIDLTADVLFEVRRQRPDAPNA